MKTLVPMIFRIVHPDKMIFALVTPLLHEDKYYWNTLYAFHLPTLAHFSLVINIDLPS